MRLNLIKRRIARLMAFVLIFLMMAQPFSDVYIYADEDIEAGDGQEMQEGSEPEAEDAAEQADEAGYAVEETLDSTEEAAGDTPPVSFNIIFYRKKSGGNWEERSSTYVEAGKKFSDYSSLVPEAPNPDKDTANQLSFKGWGENSSGPVYSFEGSNTIPTRNTDWKFYEVWKNYYILTFDHNYENDSDITKEFDDGVQTTTVSANPRDGYAFVRWCSDPACTTQYLFNSPLTNNTTVYAQWKKKHKITFLNNTGMPDVNIPIQEKLDGETIDEPSVDKEGYDFKGWFTDQAKTNQWTFTTVLTDAHPFDFKLYPKWTKQKRTVSFNYGGFGSDYSSTVDYETVVSKPADPSGAPAGCVFDGWYQKSGDKYTTKWDFSYTVKHDMILYAKFSPVVYDVEYNQNGKSAVNMPSDQEYKTVNLGAKIKQPVTDPADSQAICEFTGWYKNSGCTEAWDFDHAVSEDDAINGKIILYAGWKTIHYTVSFSSNVDLDVASQNVVAKGWPEKPAVFTDGSVIEDYPGKMFLGWYKDPDLKKDKYDFLKNDAERINESLILYGKWEDSHTVSFNTYGGTAVPTIKVVSGQRITTTIKDPQKTGFTFDGWYKEPELINKWDFTDNSEVVNEDITLHAKWNVRYFDAKFFDGKSKYPIDQKTVSFGGLVPETDKTVVSEGKVFNGWYKFPENTKWDFDSDTMPAEELHLYPGWDDILYTVSFNSKGAGAVPEQKVLYDHTLSEPVISREGYTLAGWYTDESFTTDKRWKFASDKVKGDMWLYANWLDRYCQITFDTNGGSNIPSTKVKYGKTLSMSAIPTKKGSVFKGWYTDKACTAGKEYVFSTLVKDDFTLYAGWDKAPQVSIEVVCGSNGTADPKGNFTVDEGATQIFRFIPDTGYEVDKLTDNGKAVEVTDNKYTLENITGYHKLYVTFKKKFVRKYIISADSADENGTITPVGQVYVPEGNDQTFRFEPFNGYEVDYVDVDGAKITVSDNKYTFEKVTGEHIIIVHFRKKETPPPLGYVRVRFMVDGEETSRETVSIGQTVKRPADPEKSGFIFMGWYDGNWKWNFADPVERNLELEAKFISQTVSNDDVHSGMDDRMNLSDPDDITMVKGQSYDFGPGIWSSSNKQIISIKKKTGVAKAKNASGVPVTITNTAVTPNVSYRIKVVAPELSSKKLTMGVGSTQKISVLYSGGLNVAWMSSNPKVASVDEGTITAIAKGKANVCAYLNGRKYTCKVTVSDKFTAPDSFDDVTSFTLRLGQTLNLKNISVEGAKPNKLDWRIIDEDGSKDVGKSGWLAWDDGVVRINVNGKLKAKGVGTSTIIGRRGDTRVKTIKVNVDTIPTKTETYINVGRNEKLSYYGVNNKKAHWTATNEGEIVLLGSTSKTMGTVYGVNVGTSVVSCSYNGIKYSTKVHVEDPELLTEDSRIGRTGNNEYLLTLKSGTRFVIDLPDVSQQVTWKSRDKKIAFVDENGIIEGRKQGKTSVSAKINGTTVTIKVFVTQ